MKSLIKQQDVCGSALDEARGSFLFVQHHTDVSGSDESGPCFSSFFLLLLGSEGKW